MFILKTLISISIHALRGEGDGTGRQIITFYLKFQSTPSVGRATRSARWEGVKVVFQSTPSVGRATIIKLQANLIQLSFQSTPSVGRATHPLTANSDKERISIHALRGEGDDIQTPVYLRSKNFNPRPPWGGRPSIPLHYRFLLTISIHALRGEGDSKNIQICNIVFVYSAHKTIYFCNSCVFN